LDVTKEEDVSRARQEVDKTLGNRKLWALVNNAGILASTEIEMGSMQSFIAQMNINCIGIVRVTKAFLPLLRPSKGRVVNMASLAGRFSIPGMVGYCMSKSGVVSFSEGLRREMKKWDIDVITVEPHLFKTNLCNDEAQKRALERAWNETPEDIRDDYGSCYFQGYHRMLDKVLGSARPRINDVVDTMYLAVTEQFVGPTYRVLGDLERIRVWVYQFIPDRVLDMMSHLACIVQTGKPAALIRAAIEKKRIQ
jgi:NAD(P)-dependent dehydrogenase (short-subunit alcohol dehydrogenase family)